MEICDSTPFCTEIYRDVRKIGSKVRSRSGHIRGPRAEKQCKYKLKKLLFKQAEQTTLLKSLKDLTFLSNHKTRTIAIYTQNKVNLELLSNNFINSLFKEDTRHKIPQLIMQNWSIHFGWEKAQCNRGK